MPLEPRDKELAAIGASIGANCEPCIEHHLAAAGDAGLSSAELDDAVATAHAVRRGAVTYFAARIEELLGHATSAADPIASGATSKPRELVALGVCVGANSHPLLRAHINAALDAGLEVHQIKSALKMAGYVQQHAATLTAQAVTRAMAEPVGTSGGAVGAG